MECKAPFVGTPTSASCSGNNTDPIKVMNLTVPHCICPDPDTILPGYQKIATGEWECTEGYIGNAVLLCTSGSECFETPQLMGCEQLMPCITPTTSSCQYDLSKCAGVMSGDSCEVACRWPYYGTSTVAKCPDNTTVPSTSLDWEADLLECDLVCPDPSPFPEGYNKSNKSDASWVCASTHTGQVSMNCSVTPQSCSVLFDFEGCTEMAACRAPYVDSCEYDASTCWGLFPGEPCEISCRAPYQGQVAHGTCPAGNVNESRLMDYELPSCNSTACVDPDPIAEGLAGYVSTDEGGYACAEGFAGKARKVCRHRGSDCELWPKLEGCKPIVPCRFFITEPSDICKYAAPTCALVQPGTTCDIECKQPFVGEKRLAFCPPGNTDASGLLYVLPACAEASSFDPLPVPLGYMRTRAGWQCEPGFAGALTLKCDMLENCNADIQPEGCSPVLPCKVGAFKDGDSREFWINGTLQFGPAQLADDITEAPVTQYEVYFADDCNRSIGAALAVRKGFSLASCCTGDAYTITLDKTPLPEQATQLMVVARTSPIELKAHIVGVLVHLEDHIYVAPRTSATRARTAPLLAYCIAPALSVVLGSLPLSGLV